MSVGAICFTSSSSNGGCWGLLVFPCLFFVFCFFEKRIFFPICDLRQKKKKVYVTPKKISGETKKHNLRPPKN